MGGSAVLDNVGLNRYSLSEIHAQLKISKGLEQTETKCLCLFSFSTYFLEFNSLIKVVLVMVQEGKRYYDETF